MADLFPTAREAGLMLCQTCHALMPVADRTHCHRCATRTRVRKPHSWAVMMSLTLTAMILYIPANLYPIMSVTRLGRTDDKTIIGGVVELWVSGAYPLAFIVFFASVFVPMAKFGVLLYLGWQVKYGRRRDKRQLTHMYHITEAVGRWSMIDVFVVATLAALIQAGVLANISPGVAASAFAAMVVVTMIAAEAFDPRLLWDRE